MSDELPRTNSKQFFPVDEYVDYGEMQKVKPRREKVSVKSLTGTQGSIHSGFREQPNASDKPISVFRSAEGKDYIIEGHHRTARAIERGDTHIEANVWDTRKSTKWI